MRSPADGAYPYDVFDGGRMTRDDVRRLFRRMGWAFPVARQLGLAARMSADQHAEVNIELQASLSAADIDILQ